MQLTRKPKQNGETQAHEGTCGNRHGGKQQASKKSNKRARSTSPMSAAEGQCIDVLANLHQSTKPCKQNTSVVGTLNGGTRCTVSWAHAVICNCGSERPSTRSRFATSRQRVFGSNIPVKRVDLICTDHFERETQVGRCYAAAWALLCCCLGAAMLLLGRCYADPQHCQHEQC